MTTGLHSMNLSGLRPARWIVQIILAAIILTSPVFSTAGSGVIAASGISYYVDCQGDDARSGTSPSQAWRTLAKANRAPLEPGDSLLLMRGCTYTGPLNASWTGAAGQPILISAYGSGELPIIHNGPGDLADGYHNNVDITGSYLVLEHLEVAIRNPPVVEGCKNNPVGFFIGFNFRNPDNISNGGSYNLLRSSKASGHTAGAHLQNNTSHNRVFENRFTNNHVMRFLTPVSVNAFDDVGAWGILLKGSDHEVAYNYFSNNNAWCTYDTPAQGNSIELFEARNNLIHHNTSINDRDFSELGGSAAIKSTQNTLAYNLVISSIPDSHFVMARGNRPDPRDNIPWGPTTHTRLYHNTVYYTGVESQGIICSAGCMPNILTAHNNILWAEWKAAYADGRFQEGQNLYWNSSGNPFVQFQGFQISPTSMLADPNFMAPGKNNYLLSPTSPAIDAGTPVGWDKDLRGTTVPQGAGSDLGAYEYFSFIPASIFLPILHQATDLNAPYP